ncbi:E3 ubiquitin-protein ligase RNF213 [Exaiptasia diaphana]|nr:E3 ubiquitin-protein ligase RNF213 [Exaiptasia diaphana]
MHSYICDQKVKEYMTQFIQRAQDLVQVELVAVEVLVMCVQCMEDALSSKLSKRASELPLEQNASLIDRYCKKACSILSNPQSTKLNVDWLEGVALIRLSLSLTAGLMYQFVNESQEMQVPTVQRALQSIFNELQKVFCNATYTRPRLFFLKQLSRRYGFESIGLVAKKFGWILPQEGSETFEVSQDRFLAYGREYQSLRETLARSIITGDMKDVEDIQQGMTLNMTSKNVVLLLGLFQEITANPGVPIPDVVGSKHSKL